VRPRVGLDPGLGGRHEVRHGGHDLVHQTLLQGFGWAQLLAFEQQRQRLLEAN